MNLSWIDELVSAEKVLPSSLITEIKKKLHSDKADEIMEKMVEYKWAHITSLQIQQDITEETHPNQQERWIADYKSHLAYRTQKQIRDTLSRELMVLLRGEETVKREELEDVKYMNKKSMNEFLNEFVFR
jgi:Rps23 Pro-64 3,4-dihydroxylase Tpa1-like proline 4-hydroxylase